ncbi:MAG: MBL fold metallo-hydrolase [Gemmatimonadaceae bacterium]|nr:MBL fold metallo-hydrolase [Gemmatimonadaceae bacterium]
MLRRCAAAALLLLTTASVAQAQRRFTTVHRCTPAQRDAGCLIVLGSGTPVPDPERLGPAYAFVFGDQTLLFDAGAGVMRRVAGAGLRIDGFTSVFLTHLHSDHTLGLPDVLLTTWVMGRRTPQRLIGPPGTERMTASILDAWKDDIAVRTDGLERGQPGGQRADVREITGGVVHDSAGLKVTAIAVPHGEWKHAFAYVIETPTRRIVLSGDAAPGPALEAAARDADVLVHETYPEMRLRPEARPGGDAWPRYMRSVHTSDREVGVLAAKAGVKLVVLSHVVRMGGTDAELVAGVRRGGYNGPLRVARDRDVY